MSLQQSAFLFDYQAFYATAAPLKEALEIGNVLPLQESVNNVMRNVITTKDWILHDKGTILPEQRQIQLTKSMSERDKGYAFLVVLSEFLRPSVSLGYDWHILAWVLPQIGWSEDEAYQLYAGKPLASLLDPNAPHRRKSPVKLTDPYWYWLGAHHSAHEGWLRVEEITRVLEHLKADLHLVEGDVNKRIRLPLYVSSDRAELSKEYDPDYWYARISIAYNRAIEMLSQAASVDRGLYLVVYEQEGTPENDPG